MPTIHGRKQIVWRCENRIEYGTKFCSSSPSLPEEELHRAILKAVQDTPFLDDRLKKLNNKIKSLKKVIEDSTARQEKVSQPEMLLSAKDLQIQEYDDALTARIIEKITVRARNEIEIRFIGGYKKTMRLA